MVARNVSAKTITFFIFYYLFCLNLKAKVDAEFCDPKHQINVKTMEAFGNNTNVTKIIEVEGFDRIPSETLLEKEGDLFLINFIYDDPVPTIKVDFESILFVKGTFRFKFLYSYFSDFEFLLDEKTTPPNPLRAVFYDENAKSFERAAATDKSIIVLEFDIQLGAIDGSNFVVVREDYSANKTFISNRNLEFWIDSSVENFYVCVDRLLELGSATVLLIHVDEYLIMSPDIVNMFASLMPKSLNSESRPQNSQLLPSDLMFASDAAQYVVVGAIGVLLAAFLLLLFL